MSIPCLLWGGQAQFRAAVDLIQIDVSVLDGRGQPVLGLTGADFEIREDGRPQRLVAFHPVSLPGPPPVTAGWMREVTTDVSSNSLENRRLFVIVLDDATVELDPRILRSAKQIARGIVDRLGPHDLAAVVFTRDNRNSQDFTQDRARLLKAIDSFDIGFRGAGVRDDYWFESSIRVLWEVAEYLAAIPDQRKSILYVGQGVPLDTDQFAPMLISSQNVQAISQRETQIGLTRRLIELIDRARRANVSIFLFDACGLRAAMSRSCAPGKEVEYLQTVAENTGGRAFVNTNTFTTGLDQTFRETSAYYMLGYVSDAPASGKSFRRISVNVNRPGIDVRARSGYFPAAPLPDPPSARAAIAGLLPKRELRMRAIALPLAVSARSESAVIVSTSIDESDGLDTPIVARVEVLVSAFTPEGEPRGTSRAQTFETTRRGGQELQSHVFLAAGRYQLRIAAHRSDGKSGSVYVDVDVPDFTRAPVSIVGPVFTRSAPGTIDLEPVGEPALPVVPMTRRTFSPDETTLAFARIYQGGRGTAGDVTVLARLIDSRGSEVFRTSGVLLGRAFGATRSADWQLALPLTKLEPGPYLLELETKLGTRVVRRQVPFEVGSRKVPGPNGVEFRLR